MAIGQSIKNTAIACGISLNPVGTNLPSQYKDRHRQYFDPETRRFTQEYAKYSSDFVEAQVQGLDPENPLAWGTYRIRFADVVKPSSAIQRYFDDYKQFLFESARIEYIQRGTKIVTMGSTWLVTNPQNISGSSGSGICRRCNAVWNHLDYYGNAISEPVIKEGSDRANASDSDYQQGNYITKGYFNILCQYNNDTKQIDTNTRMIFGNSAYRVTGPCDFDMEFTGDYSSVRTVGFTIRYEEPNDSIDDMENHVAGGKSFSWDIALNGPTSLSVGSTATMTAISKRNGVEVISTEENPISYQWESSNKKVVKIDKNGNIIAEGEGKATIVCTLSQNENYTASVEVSVSLSEDGVFFIGNTPDSISQFDSVTLKAAYFEDGQETEEEISWDFVGAENGTYSTSVNGNTATITCYGYSDTPLAVNASCGAYTASVNILLEGI